LSTPQKTLPSGSTIRPAATRSRVHDSARRYEVGSQNLQTVLAFRAALDYLQSIGFENIRNRIAELTDYLLEGLKKSAAEIVSPTDRPEERSPIVSFSLGAENRDYVRKLARESIMVSLRDGNIRVAVNIFNNFEDIDRLLSALQEMRP